MFLLSDPIVVAVVAGTGAASTVIDVRTRRVPNKLTFTVAVLGVALACVREGPSGLGSALAGLAFGLAVMLPGHIFGATGAGDVKLFAALGTLLGPGAIVPALVYTAIVGGVLALGFAAWRGCLRDTVLRTATLVGSGGANTSEIEHGSSNNRFPYAPAIALGALAAAVRL